MTPFFHDDHLTLYGGDCRTVLAELPAESVHCVVTSPPYWGLRDYGVSDQLGLEPTPEAYVENMVAVFREVRRVLRADGTLWLNLGDSYAAGRTGHDGKYGGVFDGRDMSGVKSAYSVDKSRIPGLKPKDLVGIPWRVAFALQADGWYLRSDIIWSKPNPMPESVTDRPTKAHEYLFLLSKSPRYYFDADAVREASLDTGGNGNFAGRMGGARDTARSGGHGTEERPAYAAGRNLRSVWTIATEPYPGAHFATFPRKLVEPCVKAGTSERGVCPECGAPWRREVERTSTARETGNGWQEGRTAAGHHGPSRPGAFVSSSETTGWSPPKVAPSEIDRYGTGEAGVHRKVGGQYQKWLDEHPKETVGWTGPCEHTGEPVPAVVLDPFAGSGTTLLVAQALGRRGVGVDLNPEYLRQALTRNAQTPLGLLG